MGLCDSVSSRLGAYTRHPRGAILPVLWFFLCVALTFKGKFYMKRGVKSPVSQYITHADVCDYLLHDYLHTEISRIVME